jgi:hypothetical protein
MKKTEVISGAGNHQVALSPDERLAGSKRVNRQPAISVAATPSRRKKSPTAPALKNSALEPIPEQTRDAVGADLEARIRQLGQVTEHLRSELDTLTKASHYKG